MKLSLVIPCYNEEKNLPLILNRLKESITRSDIEVILVDNGSQDGSKKVLEQILPDFPFARSVHIEVNEGYGNGVVRGLREAKGEFLAWTHADMQTDPKDVVKGLELIESRKDPESCYVKGYRKGRPLADVFFTVGMTFFELLLLWKWLWDINAQPNIFSRQFFDSWKDAPKDFSLDLYALYQAKKRGKEVIRFPVVFPERIHGSSSWNVNWRAKVKFIMRTVNFSWKLIQQMEN